LEEFVRPFRAKNNRAHYREKWWIHAEPRPGFRAAIAQRTRYIATARVAKHRLFVWLDSVVLPDSKVIAIAFDDDHRFGVLHSRVHEIWTLATCGWHGKGNDATYNPTECFETFPFPFPDDLQPPTTAVDEGSPLPKPPPHPDLTPEKAYADAAHYYMAKEEPARPAVMPRTPAENRAVIAAAAKELNELRERWLNPPEWTETRVLEFPGTVGGPWHRYIDPSTINPQLSTGLVRYPRLVPRDAECAARLKKRTLTNLYNDRPAWLDLAHKKLDAAVAAAYGWVRAGQATVDLTDEQILEKLLALNLERAAEEAKTAKVKKPKAQRAKHAEEML
jgi:hypothetical protein